MSVIKIAVVAASLVMVAATANAFSREDLNSGYHGNSSAWNAPYHAQASAYDDARGAYARSTDRRDHHRVHRVYHPARPRHVR